MDEKVNVTGFMLHFLNEHELYSECTPNMTAGVGHCRVLFRKENDCTMSHNNYIVPTFYPELVVEIQTGNSKDSVNFLHSILNETLRSVLHMHPATVLSVQFGHTS